MKLSINDILSMEENQNKTVLQMKATLIKMKKSGELFFREDLMSLDIDIPFHIYFYVMPSKKSEKNAFPIPLEEYLVLPRNEDKRKKELEKFYKKYYEKNPIKGIFNRYDYKSYTADSFVWFYHE